MRKIIMAVVVVAVFSGSAFADVIQSMSGSQRLDVSVNPSLTSNQVTTNTNTNISDADSTSISSATGGKAKATGGNANVNIRNPVNLIGQQYGTNFVNPGIAIESTEWKLYYAPVYRKLNSVQIEKMKRKGQFSDIFPWNWKKHVHESWLSEPLPGKPTSISMMQYWPKDVAYESDQVILSLDVNGDAYWVEEAFLGMAADACLAAGSDRWAILARTNSDGKSKGFSVSVGGVASSTVPCGNKAVAVTSGGQIGTITTSTESRKEFQVLCMNPGPLVWETISVPTPKATPQKPTCDRVTIQIRIDDAERRIVRCTTWCFKNMENRRDAAEANIDMFVCTGELRYLRAAKFHFLKLRDNYLKGGSSIRANQASADEIMSKAYLDWAISIKTLEGKKAAYKFVSKYNLDMNVETLPVFTK